MPSYHEYLKLIVKSVSKKTGVSMKDMRGKSRRQDIVRARRIAMRRCYKAGFGLSEIGRFLNRSHSDVWHHVNGTTMQDKTANCVICPKCGRAHACNEQCPWCNEKQEVRLTPSWVRP